MAALRAYMTWYSDIPRLTVDPTPNVSSRCRYQLTFSCFLDLGSSSVMYSLIESF